MNDLQKKFAIVGATAFIVWFLMALEAGAFGSDVYDFIGDAIYGWKATWIQTITFITWLGSLIAFNIYKD